MKDRPLVGFAIRSKSLVTKVQAKGYLRFQSEHIRRKHGVRQRLTIFHNIIIVVFLGIFILLKMKLFFFQSSHQTRNSTVEKWNFNLSTYPFFLNDIRSDR